MHVQGLQVPWDKYVDSQHVGNMSWPIFQMKVDSKFLSWRQLKSHKKCSVVLLFCTNETQESIVLPYKLGKKMDTLRQSVQKLETILLDPIATKLIPPSPPLAQPQLNLYSLFNWLFPSLTAGMSSVWSTRKVG